MKRYTDHMQSLIAINLRRPGDFLPDVFPVELIVCCLLDLAIRWNNALVAKKPRFLHRRPSALHILHNLRIQLAFLIPAHLGSIRRRRSPSRRSARRGLL